MAPTNKPFRLLDLPREMRDQVYREFLTPAIGNQKRKSYSLKTAILYASRQVHREASRILYGESCWVLLTTTFRISDRTEHYNSLSNAPFAILQNGTSSFGGEFAMRIDIDTYAQTSGNGPDGLDFIVASVYDLQRTFNAVAGRVPSASQIDIGVQQAYRKHPHHHERMLAFIHEIRGVQKASIRGFQPESLAKEMSAKMMTPVRDVTEEIDRFRSFQTRGDRQMALGKLLDAAMIYKDGYHYTRRGLQHDMAFTRDLTRQEVTDMNLAGIALVISCCFCYLKLGNIWAAKHNLEAVLKDPGLTKELKATALYYLGLAFHGKGSVGKAVFCFLQAWHHCPAHGAVGRELDILDKKLDEQPYNGIFTPLTSKLKKSLDTCRQNPGLIPEMYYGNQGQLLTRTHRVKGMFYTWAEALEGGQPGKDAAYDFLVLCADLTALDGQDLFEGSFHQALQIE